MPSAEQNERMTRVGSGFGDAFVDYFVRIKEFELGRFNAETTAWEQREYFDLF